MSISRVVSIFCVFAWAYAHSAHAQSNNPRFWESPLPREPFEATPFRPIKVPLWVQETTGVGYTLSGMTSAQRAEAAGLGVTISELGFVDPFYPYYDSKLLHRRSPHVTLDRLPKEIAEYKRLGIRILAVYPPTLQGEVYEAHPDWRRISTDSTEIPQIDLKKYPHGGMLCPLGPYGDFFIEVLAEILEKFPEVDAFSFDGLHHGGVCYCAHCRTAYKNDTGLVIPPADLENPAFRRYQHWADRRLENLVQRMQTRIKSIKPEVALITWSTNAGRFGHFLSVPRNMPSRMNLLFDAPDQEFWLDESNRGATIVPAFANAYIWATTNHRSAFSEPYLMSHGNPYGKDGFPTHEMMRRMMMALTHGASPSLAVGQPERMKPGIRAALDALKSRKPWLTHKTPEPYIALLMSDNAKTFGARSSGRVEEGYLSHVLGFFRALLEEHRVITVINDWNLNPTDLSRYKVLILPNAMCLDARQISAIEGFVDNGGGLVASLESSMLDEFGDPRPNFALSKLLGVDYRGLPTSGSIKPDASLDVNFAKAIGPDYWGKRKNVFDFRQEPKSFLNQGKMAEYVGTDLVTFKGSAVRVALNDPAAQTLGSIRARSEAGDSPEFPAIVARSHGKGRVIYFAAGIDSAYYLYSYPYQRALLLGAVDWVAAETRPPVTIAAPMCVQTSVMRQEKNGRRLLVHLYNDVNTTASHALPNDDVPLREETIPILDIALTFRRDYRLGRVHLEPEGRTLEGKSTPVGTRIVVPRLDVHSIVVAELVDEPL